MWTAPLPTLQARGAGGLDGSASDAHAGGRIGDVGILLDRVQHEYGADRDHGGNDAGDQVCAHDGPPRPARLIALEVWVAAAEINASKVAVLRCNTIGLGHIL